MSLGKSAGNRAFFLTVTRGERVTKAAMTKAQERYADLLKKDRAIHHDIQSAQRQLHEKTLRLRQLRLLKEAEDAAEKKALKAKRAARSGVTGKPAGRHAGAN